RGIFGDTCQSEDHGAERGSARAGSFEVAPPRADRREEKKHRHYVRGGEGAVGEESRTKRKKGEREKSAPPAEERPGPEENQQARPRTEHGDHRAAQEKEDAGRKRVFVEK